ncbi:MAG: hypothetical protein ACREQV_26285, partial [Candidatus Binatia bacterium]
MSLSAGTVNLAFRQREHGTKLDQIILTTDLNFTPGQSAPTSFDFSLADGGNKSVTRGQSVGNVITATRSSGSAQSVSFSTSGLPSGASASYSSSNSCSPTCSRTLNIATSSSTPTGTYTITVTGSGGGLSRTTAFNLTVTSSTSTSNNMVSLEAESGTRTSPMVVASDSQASAGKYVHVPVGQGNNYNDSTKGGPGEIRFAISIPQSGTRALWARTIAPSGGSDSFYVTRNGSLIREWYVPISTSWRWNKVANVSLSSGTVNLAFRHREPGTKLDQIILTSDLNFTPGQSAPALAAVAFSASESNALSISVVKTLTNIGS